MRHKTTHEIIDEIASYYNLTNRGVVTDTYPLHSVSNICRYYTEDGKMCAIGRMLVNPEAYAGISARVGYLLRDNGDSILKPKYRKHSLDFYDDVQLLHDNKTHWTETGLSDTGKLYVEVLKRRYKNY